MDDRASTDLTRSLHRWQDAGLISADQAESIARFETDPMRPADGRVAGGGTSLLAEGLAYLGASLALGAVFVLLEEFWFDLVGLARVAPVAVGTIVIAGAAAALRDRTEGALHRLCTLLQALAVVGLAVTAGVVMAEFTNSRGDAGAAVAGAVGFVAAIPVHRNRPTWPTTLVLGGSLLTAVSALGMLLVSHREDDVIAIVFTILGLSWAALGWRGWLPPQPAVEVTGLAVGFMGIQLLAFDSTQTPALIVGLLIAGATLGIGLREDRTPPAVLGGMGLTVYAPQVVNDLFGESLGAPLALLVGGVTLVVIAVTLIRRQTG